MTEITKWIDVNVPVRTAYDQWTQFESFPQFMEGVEEVKQLDDSHLHWKVTIGGKTQEYDAVVTEQLPNDRVAWKSTSGTPNAGVVTFHRLSEDQTRVTVQISWEPQDMTEKVGSSLGFDDRQIQQALENFKRFIEERGAPTGAWRGTVEQGQTK